jgi:hypothetical protein
MSNMAKPLNLIVQSPSLRARFFPRAARRDLIWSG